MNFFVTGTDTDCGKTLVTLGLMQRYHDQGVRVAGMKPVAAGAMQTREGLRNMDALAIQALCHQSFPYEQINPYCFEPPVAPHLAADQKNRRIEAKVIQRAYRQLDSDSEVLIVEGAGGWKVPLDDDGLDMEALCNHLDLPVVLVVGLQLGCINHALLSSNAILTAGRPLIGWVANHVGPHMPLAAENIHTLRKRIPAPLLGHIPRLENPGPSAVAGYLSLPDGA